MTLYLCFLQSHHKFVEFAQSSILSHHFHLVHSAIFWDGYNKQKETNNCLGMKEMEIFFEIMESHEKQRRKTYLNMRGHHSQLATTTNGTKSSSAICDKYKHRPSVDHALLQSADCVVAVVGSHIDSTLPEATPLCSSDRRYELEHFNIIRVSSYCYVALLSIGLHSFSVHCTRRTVGRWVVIYQEAVLRELSFMGCPTRMCFKVRRPAVRSACTSEMFTTL